MAAIAPSRYGYLLIALAISPLHAAATAPWLRLRTPHFELITNAGNRYAPGLLLHLEQLRRLFLAQVPIPENSSDPPVRIIAFSSPSEYAAYRLSEHATAYFFGAPGRDYIVMSLTGPADFHIAAHEYAHAAAHRRGLRLPAWLSEGLAEVFATARFQSGRAILGNPNPARLNALLRNPWIPLGDIIRLENGSRDPDSMFYAESWALTHMLMFFPLYSARFDILLGRCTVSVPGPSVLGEVYSTSLPLVERALHAWIAKPHLLPVAILSGPEPGGAGAPEPLARFDADLALAELQLVIGQRQQAKAAYLRLEAEPGANPEIQAALGRIALEEGRRSEARERFGRAMTGGIRNARLCFEYAVLAQDAGMPNAEVAAALDRALALDPKLDDARFALALLHMNAGRYRAALQHFQALRVVPERQAFAYFNGLAYSQVELGLHDDAVRSAAEALKHAHTEDEADSANSMAWMAQSELVVQITADGSAHFRRIPRRDPAATDDWNPFIAPGDRIERREGALREVDCSGVGLRLTVIVNNGPLVLSMPDPGRVRVRPVGPGAAELTCGKQDGPRVLIEYAVTSEPGIAGILRGVQFLP